MRPTDAEALIRRQIQEAGRITFARFMELALFAPGVGYYMRGHPPGAEGDYFTAPATHPAFGALVALQLRQAWQLLGRPQPFTVVEMGAGQGLLGRDILAYAAEVEAPFARSLRYLAVDPAPPMTPPSQGSGQQWLRGLKVPARSVVGCFLANELVDAFPVHRFQVQDGRLLEVYVTLRDGALAEELDEPSTPELERYLREQGVRLPEGFRGEVCLKAETWMAEVAGALKRGLALVVDYGHTAEELYSPPRAGGTLRCYYRHTLGGNPFQRVGAQDMTAHVNFSQLVRVAERHGLALVGFATQREFLRNLGLEVLLEQLPRRGLPRREEEANRVALRELVKPGGMGDFRVLALAQGIQREPLHGFHRPNPLLAELRRRAPSLPIPLRRQEHVPLLEGRYPQGEVGFTLERLWPWDEDDD